MSKIVIVAVGAAAYVLGAKAGHQRYEQIMSALRRLRRNPQVQQKASEAADVVKHKVVPGAKNQLQDGAKRASEAVKSDTTSAHGQQSGTPASGIAGAGR